MNSHEDEQQSLNSQTKSQLDSSTQTEGHWTKALLFAVLAAAFGSSFQFGYHIGCINIPEAVILNWVNETHFNMTGEWLETKFLWSLSVSIFAVGGMINGVLVGIVADRFGRKLTLLYNNVLAVIAAALMTGAKYSNSWMPTFLAPYWVYIIGRFVIGLNAGLNSGVAAMYMTEISPANLRGTIGSFAQLFITIAILFSQILGLPGLLGNNDRWPFIFGFAIVPVIVQLLTLPFCPESPKFTLVVRGQKDQAEKDLKKLRGEGNVIEELEQINAEAVAARSQAKVTIMDMFSEQLRWPLILAVFMMVSQQLSGINAVMFYSSPIFKGAGLDDEWANYATIAMGTINVLMTVVSVYLVDHPRFGRRTLHIAGLVGMFITTALIALSMILSKLVTKSILYMSILFVLLFVISFATGPGSIPWFYVNELFPSNARANANSFAVFTNWFFTFVIGISFPPIEGILHEYTFFVFTALLSFFIMFSWKFLPETKNKSLEEVEEEMNRLRGTCLR